MLTVYKTSCSGRPHNNTLLATNAIVTSLFDLQDEEKKAKMKEREEERKRLRDLAMRMQLAWDEVVAALEAVQAPGGNTKAILERLSRANDVVASLQENC